jgi:hypothetical protein
MNRIDYLAKNLFLGGKWGKQVVSMHFDGDPSEKLPILFYLTKEDECT